MTDAGDATLHTPGGVRLRLASRCPGSLNWLFLPGGPGIGSESLLGLVEATQLPGSCWLVDLPGDGSNVFEGDPFQHWPGVLIEAAQALPDCVYVGHSTGGMYLLATAPLEAHLVGLVLVSSAPDARWHVRYVAMAEADLLPALDRAVAAFERSPDATTLRDLAVESAPWNFQPAFVAQGRQLLAAMPYNLAAVAWSDAHFDHVYAHAWWPRALPTLIVSGACDRIVAQDLWDEPGFQAANVQSCVIGDAGHFPWVEQPEAVRAAFADFAVRAAAHAATRSDHRYSTADGPCLPKRA